MRVAGKAPPEKEELEKAGERGFENLELFLEKEHLENFDESKKLCKRSDLNVVSVHTPHVTLEEAEYFVKSGELARELDAYLVLHSQYMHHVHIPEIEKLNLKSEYGFENDPGVSLHHLEKQIFDRGHDLVLDVAHLYISTGDFQGALEEMLRTHGSEIKLIHLCDSTDLKDGIGLGQGEMNIEKTIYKIRNSEFNGDVVLEVMPENQREALQKWMEI